MTNKVKIFTSSGTFTPKADKDNRVHKGEYTKHEGAYIQASGGEETIVHDKCGTPDCCQRCESDKSVTAYGHVKRRTQ